jgi:uncharacterized protein (DUF1499 family)
MDFSFLSGIRYTFWKQAVSGALSIVLIVVGWGCGMAGAEASVLSSPVLIGSLFHFSGSRPDALGVKDGQLQPCPNTPNCVNSQTGTDIHAISPLHYSATPAEAISKLKQVIQSQPGAAIVQATDDYLYAEFTSALMGFVDDVEFYWDSKAQAIQVRSASRLGESDLGVNRDRIETLRKLL